MEVSTGEEEDPESEDPEDLEVRWGGGRGATASRDWRGSVVWMCTTECVGPAAEGRGAGRAAA